MKTGYNSDQLLIPVSYSTDIAPNLLLAVGWEMLNKETVLGE